MGSEWWHPQAITDRDTGHVPDHHPEVSLPSHVQVRWLPAASRFQRPSPVPGRSYGTFLVPTMEPRGITSLIQSDRQQLTPRVQPWCPAQSWECLKPPGSWEVWEKRSCRDGHLLLGGPSAEASQEKALLAAGHAQGSWWDPSYGLIPQGGTQHKVQSTHHPGASR